MRRGCNDCAVGPGLPLTNEGLGDEARASRLPLRLDSPDDRMGR
jgi:hypothetical protein